MTRCVLFLDGGLIEDILSDFPLEAFVVDRDIEGVSPELLTPLPDGSTAYLTKVGVSHNPHRIGTIRDLWRKYHA